MEHRGITHERIIRFPNRELNFMRERIEELGWGFMYNAFPPSISPWCGNSALGEDDMLKATVANRKSGGLDMDMVFQVIRRQRINWADEPNIDGLGGNDGLEKVWKACVLEIHEEKWKK
ncbi:hypothetical protein PIB30_076927 [Stylosanthes scabra]|uniref:Uncharacterized protein n=1 Tax=Stylosanthes scabra TaxID=79078 RepID=A0ABU6XNR7_9FABA|nr:hypothetical protein [Stylosanthes scabra]